MVTLILDILKKNQVDTWWIEENSQETAELFFVKKKLDMRRIADVKTTRVTVFRDFEKDGVTYRGNAAFMVEPSMTEQEISDKCKRAYMAAAFVPNPYYEIADPVREECIVMESDLAELSMEEAAGKVAAAIYKADCDEKSYVNSAEVFVEKTKTHILNSRGVDVSFVKYNTNGEFVGQCKEPLDVETHRSFSYDSLNTKALTEEVRETLQLTKDRAYASEAPKAGTYDVILSGAHVATIFEYYTDRSSGGYIYQGYSDFKTGEFVQGKKEEIEGQMLNLTYIPTQPFSIEGTPMKELPCIENGVFKNIHAGVRFAHYLNVPATGVYEKLACEPGQMSFEEMKKQKGLYVVNFSDFQMDALSGCYGGEIRLAYLNDGEKITPVTGGSISGTIYDAQKNIVFSKETQDISTFRGPKAILLKAVSVAGA